MVKVKTRRIITPAIHPSPPRDYKAELHQCAIDLNHWYEVWQAVLDYMGSETAVVLNEKAETLRVHLERLTHRLEHLEQEIATTTRILPL